MSMVRTGPFVLLFLSACGGDELPDGSGRIRFALSATYVLDSAYMGPIARDIDGDGDVDIVTDALLRNDGHGGFAAQSIPRLELPSGGLLADLNSDGNPDLVFFDVISRAIVWFANDGTAPFAQRNTLSLSLSGSLAAGDIDGDGDDDLVVLSSDGYSMMVIEQRRPGELIAGQLQQTALVYKVSAVALADIDGNGVLDLIVAQDYGRDPYNIVGVLFGRGDRRFDPAVSYPAGGRPYSGGLAILDTDSDGDPDVVVANTFDHRVRLFRNDAGALVDAGTFATGRAPFGLAVADLDGDGHADVVSADYGSLSVSVLFGDGKTFAARGTLQLDELPMSVVVADLDGDRRNDLVVLEDGSNPMGNFDRRILQVYLQVQ
ncbi:MAG TPA: VCBS repeat-containing protein [Kofleriaceae bacterium]